MIKIIKSTYSHIFIQNHAVLRLQKCFGMSRKDGGLPKTQNVKDASNGQCSITTKNWKLLYKSVFSFYNTAHFPDPLEIIANRIAKAKWHVKRPVSSPHIGHVGKFQFLILTNDIFMYLCLHLHPLPPRVRVGRGLGLGLQQDSDPEGTVMADATSQVDLFIWKAASQTARVEGEKPSTH